MMIQYLLTKTAIVKKIKQEKKKETPLIHA